MRNKIINIVIFALGVLASIATIMFAMKYNALEEGSGSLFQNFAMYTTYVMFFLALLFMAGFAIYQIISNFKQAKIGLLGIAGIVILFVITYMLSGASNSAVEQKFEITSLLSKTVSAGLLSTYLLFVIAFLAIVWTIISGRFKN